MERKDDQVFPSNLHTMQSEVRIAWVSWSGNVTLSHYGLHWYITLQENRPRANFDQYLKRTPYQKKTHLSRLPRFGGERVQKKRKSGVPPSHRHQSSKPEATDPTVSPRLRSRFIWPASAVTFKGVIYLVHFLDITPQMTRIHAQRAKDIPSFSSFQWPSGRNPPARQRRLGHGRCVIYTARLQPHSLRNNH